MKVPRLPPTELLLLHPPVTKPGEPPLGSAILAGYLRSQGLAVELVDANLDACLWLLDPRRAAVAAGEAPGTTIRRALSQGERSLQLLRAPQTRATFARYSTAVRQLHTLLGLYGAPGERLTLGDYEHHGLSPFVPDDLHSVAEGTRRTLFYEYYASELLPRLLARSPRIVALSINYRQQVLPAFELAGLLRRHLPQVTLVAGGGMVSSWQRLLQAGLRLPLFDHVVCGPGEESLARLARGESLDYLSSGATIAFMPDYSTLPLGDYLSPQPVLPLATTRGCYWKRCRFCPEAASPTHPYAQQPAATVPALLATLAERYDVRHVHLTDNAIPVATLRALAESSAMPSGLHWHGFVRFERALLDPGLVAKLAHSGCRMLQLGLESGSQRVLDRMAKGTRLDEVGTILDNLRQAGIASYVYVMVGIPGEHGDDGEMTRRFLLEHSDNIGFLNLALMNLPRDAGLLAAAEDFGISESGLHDSAAPLGLYRAFSGDNGQGRADARRRLTALQHEPALRTILQRTPPWFTSNHAPFFYPW